MSEPAEQSTDTVNQGIQQTQAEEKNEGFSFDDGVEEQSSSETESEQDKPEVEVKGKPETPAQEGDKSGTPEGEETPDAVTKRINTLTFKRHEEREKREKAERELAEAQATIKKLQGDTDKVVIPPMPDPYDTDYERKVAERETAIRKQAEAQAQMRIEQDRQLQIVETQRREAQQRIDNNVNRMYESASKIGFTKEDFAEADRQVSRFIRNPDVASFILEREDAPLIVQYLSANVQTLEKVSTMTPMDAAVHIATVIAGEAQALKPKPSAAPEPMDEVKGKRGTPDKSPYLEGVEFE